MRSLPDSTVSLIERYGDWREPLLSVPGGDTRRLVQELAAKIAREEACQACSIVSMPRASTDEQIYAIICRHCVYDDTIVLCDALGRPMLDKAARLALADFGTYVANKVTAERRRRYTKRGRLTLFATAVGLGIVAALLMEFCEVRIGPLTMEHFGTTVFLLLGLLTAIYAAPWILYWFTATELLESDGRYKDIALLQGLTTQSA